MAWFFSHKETIAISVFLGTQKHQRKTRAYLLGRCNNEPIKVLEYLQKYVSRKDLEGNEILQKIVKSLQDEGFGEKIKFKPDPSDK